MHYRIDGDRLSADHDVKFAGLNVQRARGSDEAKSKLGVPLGLAVALLKDSRGDIDFDLPLSGTLSDKKFNWGEAMWSAVKQVLVKVLAAPFNAIGRMFTGGGDKVEELEINPVTFEPGSSVIAPSAELQITRVADFLRRSPYVKVDLSAVATKADAREHPVARGARSSAGVPEGACHRRHAGRARGVLPGEGSRRGAARDGRGPARHPEPARAAAAGTCSPSSPRAGSKA